MGTTPTFRIDGELTLDTIIGEITLDPGNGYDVPPEVEPYTLGDMLVERMVERLVGDVEKAQTGTSGQLTADVQAKADAIISAKVEAWVESALAEPLQRTNEWGAPLGEPVMIRKVVTDKVANHLRTSLDGHRLTVLDDAIKTTTKAVVANEFAAEIADVKADLRKKVRASAADVLADSIAKGLGA